VAGADAVDVPSPPLAAGEHAEVPAKASKRPAISPRARRAADELGIDWTQVVGSGRSGRIVERDVRAAATAAVPAAPAPFRAQPLSGVRRLIADRMLAASTTTAPVTLTTEIDASELVRLRAQLKEEAVEPVPGYLHLFMKICAIALVEHPALNASLVDGQIIQPDHVDLGVAVDAERGLLVPVVRSVEIKTVRQIAEETTALVQRVRAGRASPDELRGSTFSLSNLGAYEIDAFTPILNLPECAILGLGRILPKVVVVDAVSERTAMRHMQVLSLTFDHRVVDGGPAARFLQRLKRLAERPYVWLVR
jgi:pyruvate dehydrogenase E2 component (dihydrolipoamide acetyltransferase)